MSNTIEKQLEELLYISEIGQNKYLIKQFKRKIQELELRNKELKEKCNT